MAKKILSKNTVVVGEDETNYRCGLCGHDAKRRGNCGWGYVYERLDDGREIDVFLCHADDHDCYTAWTRDGQRP